MSETNKFVLSVMSMLSDNVLTSHDEECLFKDHVDASMSNNNNFLLYNVLVSPAELLQQHYKTDYENGLNEWRKYSIQRSDFIELPDGNLITKEKFEKIAKNFNLTPTTLNNMICEYYEDYI